MSEILLLFFIGVMGTTYGAVLGAALMLSAQSHLQGLFILSVYFFPVGILGDCVRGVEAGRSP